jgi:hypothetical protein
MKDKGISGDVSRVATVRFGSGSGTFWLNLNLNFEPEVQGLDWTYFLF